MTDKRTGKKGKLIAVVAPSGTGKTTLMKRLKKDLPELTESISYTTRKGRKGERDGQDYFFVSEEDFHQKRKRGEFLEWMEVHSHYYGTSLDQVSQGLERGEALFFDLDVQGCDALKKKFPESHIIFIDPGGLSVLERRLRGRGTETEEMVRVRLENARGELKRKNDFDYLILNRNLDEAYGELKK